MRGLEHGANAWAIRVVWLVALAAAALSGCDGGGGGPEDVCEGYLCSGHGTCEDQAGEPVCVCEPGYTRADCGLCAAGYHDDGAGACLPDEVTCQVDSCSGHGACDDSTGALVCTCDPGYAGDTCAACAAGYHDDGAGACVPDGDTCLVDSCSLHGLCDDSTGALVCTCDTGYTGGRCEACAADYQDRDGDGTCLPGCALTQCPAHAICDDAGGEAVCRCDDGYTGAECAECATGYQDHDGDGTCLPGCGLVDLECGLHGQCDDSSGQPACTCDLGYTGDGCLACDAGYQDHDGDGVCLPSCEALAWTCSGHGQCDDASGEAACACQAGYEPGNPGQCIPTGTGQSCGSPLWLDLGQAEVPGDTQGAGNEYAPSCQATTSAPEVVYVFDIAQPVRVTFTTDGGFDSVLYLRRNCAAGPDLACNDDGPVNVGSRLSYDFTQAGTYYLFVDGYADSAGAYLLGIEIECGAGAVFDPASGGCADDPCQPNPCQVAHQTRCVVALPGFLCACDPGYLPDGSGGCMLDPNPQGEACADAVSLTAAEGQVSGTTAGAQSDASASCGGGATGPDRVYAFSAAGDVRAHFETDGLYDSVLHLRSVCDDPGSEIECDDDSGVYPGSAMTLVLPAGSYSLWVDTYGGGAGGAYTLSYSLRANPCAIDEAACPGTPVCQVSGDWSSYACVCPAGTIPWSGQCLDDPCAPNECTVIEHKNRCVVDDPTVPPYARCECNIGYIPDPGDPSQCTMDPDANEWAFLVFLNADNNLESYGFEDVAEMGVAGSTAYVHIAALFDTYAGPAQIIYVTPGAYDVVSDEGELDMGDWQVLRDFGVWAIESYPARHHALILWNHGAGWSKGDPPVNPVLKGFSNDDHGSSAGISVANGDYARALAGITAALGGKLDLVGFDACLMGMWEVAHESEPYADYLVASEETEPGAGWAYDGFLPGLVQNPSLTPAALGSAIVEAYFQAAQSNSTLAVSDLGTLADLEAALSALAAAMMAHPENRAAIQGVAQASQSFTGVSTDLQDFAERLVAAVSIHQDIKTAAQALIAQLVVTVVYNRNQADYPGANGLATYLPTWGVEAAYSGAPWSAASSWDEFLVWLNP